MQQLDKEVIERFRAAKAESDKLDEEEGRRMARDFISSDPPEYRALERLLATHADADYADADVVASCFFAEAHEIKWLRESYLDDDSSPALLRGFVDECLKLYGEIRAQFHAA